MDNREQRGLALAALYRIEEMGGKYIVPSQRGDGSTYIVDPERRHCTCRDHEDRAIKCKHMFAVEFVQTRERSVDLDGTTTETVVETFKITKKVTYKQDWPNYNKAQTQEKRMFQEILADLCRGIEGPSNTSRGRPGVPMADVTFACAFKVYSTLSARRFTCDLQEAAAKGHIGKAPHFNVVIKHMDDAKLTPILKALIIESAKPLAAVETAIAVDSSGFSTSRFVRWFDHKWGKTMEEREWVKVHIACGVKTNVITAVAILDKDAADGPQLPGLLATTAGNFAVREVSADSAYLSQANVEAIMKAGAVPYIAMKETTTGGVGGLFAKMVNYYRFKQDEFLQHYHKRSNVETTFSMVKGKFRDHVRSKTDAGMVNEVLFKCLCHNICCLIHSVFELGITATFWGTELDKPAEAVGSSEVAMMDDVEAWAWV